MSDRESLNNYKTDCSPVFTGFYGLKNQPIFPSAAKPSQSRKDHECKSMLYPKYSPRSQKKSDSRRADRRKLEEKFQIQKQAEQNFYNLKNQINYVETMIAMYPYMRNFYSEWLSQSDQIVKTYSRIMEANDNVSFSSVYGYSQDEEIRPIYVSPNYEREIKDVSTNFTQKSVYTPYVWQYAK